MGQHVSVGGDDAGPSASADNWGQNETSMARLARLTIPGHPHHVIQRGNNRQPIVASDEDRRFLLQLLEAHARSLGVAIHGYVLMDNHFHLLATPRDDTGLP